MADLEWVEVSSSNVRSLCYEASSSTLNVMFHTGNEADYYAYDGVTEIEYNEVLSSSSVGKAVNTIIKPNHPVRHIH